MALPRSQDLTPWCCADPDTGADTGEEKSGETTPQCCPGGGGEAGYQVCRDKQTVVGVRGGGLAALSWPRRPLGALCSSLTPTVGRDPRLTG